MNSHHQICNWKNYTNKLNNNNKNNDKINNTCFVTAFYWPERQTKNDKIQLNTMNIESNSLHF